MISSVEVTRLEAAKSGDQQQFSELVEPYRKQLQVYCYRLLGSLQDAEDAVQETMLRAWRRLDTFEGRASFRAWLYKIATNVSLDALDRAMRRGLPVTLYPAASTATADVATINDPVWLDPFPDEWLDETAISTEAHYALQESVTLAFMTALQVLPPRQRAVLVLCDVLDWQASEVAPLLEMTVSAVNSALHRARTTLANSYTVSAAERTPMPADTRRLLDRYVHAWETADVTALVSLLKEDAAFAMPPSSAWFRGRDAIYQFFASRVFVAGLSFRLQPIRVSGQTGFGAYIYDPQTGQFHARAIHWLSVENGQIAALTTFLDPALFRHFGLPDALDQGRDPGGAVA